MFEIDARSKAIGIITGGRVKALEDAGLAIIDKTELSELQSLAQAKAEGRLVVLPCKVGDLQEKYRELTKTEPDGAETYTTGYQNGIRNGQAELIAYLLQIDTGTKEAAEKVLLTCNVTKLPCAGCNPCCEHREE